MPTADRLQTLPTGFAKLDGELIGHGWPQAGLIELLCDDVGVGELSLMLPAHAYLHSARHLGPTGMLWVTSTTAPHLPYAPALAQAGVNLDQLVIATPWLMQDALWTAEQGLLSGSIGIVMLWLPNQPPPDVALRRLSQAANEGNALCVLMRPVTAAQRPSPASLRIVLTVTNANQHRHVTQSTHGALNVCDADGTLELNLIKRRGLPLGKTLMLETRALACLKRAQRDQHTFEPVNASQHQPRVNPARSWLERLMTVAPAHPIAASANIRQRSFDLDR